MLTFNCLEIFGRAVVVRYHLRMCHLFHKVEDKHHLASNPGKSWSNPRLQLINCLEGLQCQHASGDILPVNFAYIMVVQNGCITCRTRRWQIGGIWRASLVTSVSGLTDWRSWNCTIFFSTIPSETWRLEKWIGDALWSFSLLAETLAADCWSCFLPLDFCQCSWKQSWSFLTAFDLRNLCFAQHLMSSSLIYVWDIPIRQSCYPFPSNIDDKSFIQTEPYKV